MEISPESFADGVLSKIPLLDLLQIFQPLNPRGKIVPIKFHAGFKGNYVSCDSVAFSQVDLTFYLWILDRAEIVDGKLTASFYYSEFLKFLEARGKTGVSPTSRQTIRKRMERLENTQFTFSDGENKFIGTFLSDVTVKNHKYSVAAIPMFKNNILDLGFRAKLKNSQKALCLHAWLRCNTVQNARKGVTVSKAFLHQLLTRNTNYPLDSTFMSYFRRYVLKPLVEQKFLIKVEETEYSVYFQWKTAKTYSILMNKKEK